MRASSWKANRSLRIRRDYSRKQFQNYMFRSRHEQRTSHKNRFFTALAIIFVGAVIGVQFSPLLAIQGIKISGTEDVSSDEIRSMVQEEMGRKRLFVFPQTNIVFFNARAATAAARERFSNIAEITIERTVARTVNVHIREHAKTMILAGPTEAYYLGERGERIMSIAEESFVYDETASGTPRIVDIRDGAKKQLPVLFVDEITGETSALFAAVGFLAAELPKRAIPVTAFHYETLEGKLVAETSEGWSAYFDPAHTIADQVEGLAAVLSQEIKDRKTVSYIDLRFENRVYFK